MAWSFHHCQDSSNVQDLFCQHFPTILPYPLAHRILSGWIEPARVRLQNHIFFLQNLHKLSHGFPLLYYFHKSHPKILKFSPPLKLGSHFLGLQSSLRWVSPVAIGPSNGSRATCWFNFRQNAEGAGIYGSQSRDDFNRDDVEQVLLLITPFFLWILWLSCYCLWGL